MPVCSLLRSRHQALTVYEVPGWKPKPKPEEPKPKPEEPKPKPKPEEPKPKPNPGHPYPPWYQEPKPKPSPPWWVKPHSGEESS
jgi:hypothetical protein